MVFTKDYSHGTGLTDRKNLIFYHFIRTFAMTLILIFYRNPCKLTQDNAKVLIKSLEITKGLTASFVG